MTDLERVGMTEDQLEEAEDVISRGRETFIEVGQALMAIRNGRGYRLAGHTTFEDYCQKRWGWHRRHGYELMAAAEVVENVRSNAQALPSLSQAVQLLPLPPEQQREVAASIDFEHTTVREVREIVMECRGPLRPAVAIDLARNGFDPSTLPSPRLSRPEYAYFAALKLIQWLDVSPADVAAAADADRIDADKDNCARISGWLRAVADALGETREHPLRILRGAS